MSVATFFPIHARRLYSIAVLMSLLWLLLIGAAQAQEPTQIYLLTTGTDHASRSNLDQRMIPARVDGQVVYRQIITGLDQPTQVRVASQSEPREALASLQVQPRLGQAVVTFDPQANALTQEAGHWYLFAYQPGGQPRSVTVAGTFNGWSMDASPMYDRGDGLYQTILSMPEGVHHYKFVVDGHRWLNDPNADRALEADDGHGGVNSGVYVGLDARQLPAPQPNHIRVEALRHDPSDHADLSVGSPTLVRLSLRTQAGDVQRVAVYIRQRGDDEWQRHDMMPSGGRMGYERFGVQLTTQPRPVRYFFELIDGQASLYLADGETFNTLNDAMPAAYRSDMQPDFHTPDWARHVVWYQIFPERFRNSDPSNDPGDAWYETWLPWTSDWWKTHTEHGEVAGERNFYRGHGNVWRRRYGGDLQGVREKLPYLRQLGVNAIYFNPIFKGESMHKYDAADFRHVDDHFGFKGDIDKLEGETNDPATWQWTASDKIFLDFLQDAREQGFRVIIDGVFNHVGRAHYAFQDVLKHGRESRYADWFEITDWGDPQNWNNPDMHGKRGGIQWHAWDGPNGHLPAFRKDPHLGLAPGPREHIFDITRRWMAPDGDVSRGIDGWRLDVPNDIPHPFWRDWRELVRSINPDALIIGEIWSWAHPWLQGDQFDAVMNYQFAMRGQSFFVNEQHMTPASQFADELYELVYAYPLPATLVMQNLYDSHDTDRLASMFVNPDRPYDQANRIQDNGPDYSPAKPNAEQWRRMKQAVTFQMTFVGQPMVYYGSEAGMWSPDDPSNRQPMIWQDLMPYEDPQVRFNEAVFEHYQRSIALRHRFEALRIGYFRVMYTDDQRQTIAFARELDDERVYVAINRSANRVRLTLTLPPEDHGATLIDWMNPRHATLIQPRMDDPATPADARPTLQPVEQGARLRSRNGQLTIDLPAYGTAVISRVNDATRSSP